MGITSSEILILIVVPIVPSFGIVFLVSIVKFVILNKQLNKSGTCTKAQIVNKYHRGSKDYYKEDKGKSYFLICEFIVTDKHNKTTLCQSKYMVNRTQYQTYSIGKSVDLIYLPNDYKHYNNLKFLNKNLIQTKTIIFRIFVALIIIFILPIIISILTKQYQFFIYPLLLALLYYGIGYYSIICFCSDKTWFKNNSFKSRIAADDDIQRFDHLNNNIESIQNDVEQNRIIEAKNDDNVIKLKKDKKVKTDDKKISLLSDDIDGI
eukprot:183719_1